MEGSRLQTSSELLRPADSTPEEEELLSRTSECRPDREKSCHKLKDVWEMFMPQILLVDGR